MGQFTLGLLALEVLKKSTFELDRKKMCLFFHLIIIIPTGQAYIISNEFKFESDQMNHFRVTSP